MARRAGSFVLANLHVGLRHATALTLVICLSAGFSEVFAKEVKATASEISSSVLDRFRFGSSRTRFGALEYAGGLEMSSSDQNFGGISAFRFLTPGERFIGVTDTGSWFFGTIDRDENGRPSRVSNFTMEAMLDPVGGLRNEDKWFVDAEAITVSGESVTVGFERVHRLAEYHIEPGNMGAPLSKVDFLIPEAELRTNEGFETLAHSPEDSPLAGARVAVTEHSIDADGNSFAAILEGPMKGVFTVALHDGFNITDGAFLPDGDLVLLERRFSLASGGLAMRLRRIDGKTIRPGGLADGPVLLDADMSYRIDNMEALDVWQRSDGATMISLMSDDNYSFLQRSLYLEFRLVQD